ncbi:MAG: gliding motility lipoprotein GldD [Algibacter sp.]
MYKNSILFLLLMICFSCDDDVVPKPKGYLRLEYPEAKYIEANLNLPFTFETNMLVKKVNSKVLNSTTESYGINIEYPLLRGTVFLTYKAIEDDDKNLKTFLRDAEKFTLEHMKKADGIPAYPYENLERKVYGKLSEVRGNVASPAQFYVTDSVNHFLTGSLYFYAKPNYDSIFPAANYLQKDMKRIMETIEWK